MLRKLTAQAKLETLDEDQPANTRHTLQPISEKGKGHPIVSNMPRKSIVPGKGPSLVGLLASRVQGKFAKQLMSRHRLSSAFGDGSSRYGNPVAKEPTYRMEPHHKFKDGKVEGAIKDVLEDRLENIPYNPKIVSNMCKVLADDIKTEVRCLNFDRYKIVVSVVMGQRRDQGVSVASRCAWDDKLDNSSSFTFTNDDIFCTATVFGVYNE